MGENKLDTNNSNIISLKVKIVIGTKEVQKRSP